MSSSAGCGPDVQTARERVRRAVRPAAIFGGTFAFLSLPAMLLGASQGTPLLSLLATEVAIFAGFGLFGFIVKLLGMDIFSADE